MSSPPLLALSPARAVWRVSWPMIAIGLLRSSFLLADAFWIGHLGDASLAAVGSAAFAWWMALLLCELAGTGVHARVASLVGSGATERIGPTVVQGVWLAGMASLVLFALSPLTGLYFVAVGLEAGGEAFVAGESYLLTVTLLGGATALHATLDGALRGLGATREALAITIGMVACNGLLDPLLIWGLGPLPELGVAGAAVASAVAAALGAVAAVALLVRRFGVVAGSIAPVQLELRRLLAIGGPVSARGILFSIIYVGLGHIITDFGELHMASLGVGHRIESVAYLICVGFEVGAATMVGQHLGAGDRGAALVAVRRAAQLGSAIVFWVAVVVFWQAEALFGLFASDPITIASGASYLRIQAWVFVPMAFECAYSGGFTGAGNTMPAFWIATVGTAARLPLAWFLAHTLGFGVEGIWVAIAVTTAIRAVTLRAWFVRHGMRHVR
jgi:putative MATE family efflux protein